MGENFWEVIRSPGVPAWLVALGFFVALFRAWPGIMSKANEARRDKEAAKDGDWSRLRREIERLDLRCEQIEEREQECQRQLTEALHRIGELEGYNLGIGEARQTAQRMVSEDREERKGSS